VFEMNEEFDGEEVPDKLESQPQAVIRSRGLLVRT
jgi:hypothetical protein